MTRFTRALAAAVLLAGMSMLPVAQADELKDDAIQRLVHTHDPEIPIAIGRIYLKQVGLSAARSLIARRGQDAALGDDWNPDNPQWQMAEIRLRAVIDDVIRREIVDPAWFYAAWGREADRILDAEEADALAHHFATPGGREQRVILELRFVGELVMTNFTMTNRIVYSMADSREEIENLQTVWWRHDPMVARDFNQYPETLRFATSRLGIKYARMLGLKGVESILDHFEEVAVDMRAAVSARADVVDEAIATWRGR